MQRVLGLRSAKRETRTDWRRRPLSAQQVQYALEDVVHLPALAGELDQRLAQLGRTEWMQEEMQRWEQGVQHQLERHSWRRLPGLSALQPQQLAVVRALWQWRNEVARRENRRPGHILRDDLLVELARRTSSDPEQIAAVRGMEWKRFRRWVPQIAEQIALALALPPEQWPQPQMRAAPEQFGTLAQLLYAVLSCRARAMQVAPSLVGTPKDLRQWVSVHLGRQEPPGTLALDQGWRKELLGEVLLGVLKGKLAVWVKDPRSETPLDWEPRSPRTDRR